jgi:predicted signal transduction protein with EAL and GGDEF domain
VGTSGVLAALKQRLGDRADSEHGQAIARIVIVSMVFVYFFSDFFALRVDQSALQSAQMLAVISIIISLAIFGAIVLYPAASVMRRLTGMLHDVGAISASVFFGEGAGAAVAVVYLWIPIGNGFRYGVGYLYGCAALSISGFILVYLSSEYWQGQDLSSLNILLAVLIVPPYVGSLLKTLRTAKDALQHQARVDSLTGLLSRSEMETAKEALFRADATGHILLFCDPGRFKEVNDVAGHAVGDKLLTDIGGIFRKAVRRHDLSGRMGGDEFCILLQDCPLKKAEK